MDLFLRKVIHPQAHDNYRVVVRDGDEIEIGSIGIQFDGWAWGIDTAIPMKEVEAQGTGTTVRTACGSFARHGTDSALIPLG